LACWWLSGEVYATAQPAPESARPKSGTPGKSLRYLVYWALRREQLCDPGLCPDAPGGEHERCGHCPLNRLDAAWLTDAGQLLRRTLDLRSALSMGIRVGLNMTT
jgi:hypothetical protein